jgi:hypothetical protein
MESAKAKLCGTQQIKKQVSSIKKKYAKTERDSEHLSINCNVRTLFGPRQKAYSRTTGEAQTPDRHLTIHRNFFFGCEMLSYLRL